MKAPRLHELTARVVAWHNRHPLAQRIDASQVHSIGEVALPFAAATASPAPASAAAGLPAAAELLAAPPAANHAAPVDAQAQAEAQPHKEGALGDHAGSNASSTTLEPADLREADAALASADSTDPAPWPEGFGEALDGQATATDASPAPEADAGPAPAPAAPDDAHQGAPSAAARPATSDDPEADAAATQAGDEPHARNSDAPAAEEALGDPLPAAGEPTPAQTSSAAAPDAPSDPDAAPEQHPPDGDNDLPEFVLDAAEPEQHEVKPEGSRTATDSDAEPEPSDADPPSTDPSANTVPDTGAPDPEADPSVESAVAADNPADPGAAEPEAASTAVEGAAASEAASEAASDAASDALSAAEAGAESAIVVVPALDEPSPAAGTVPGDETTTALANEAGEAADALGATWAVPAPADEQAHEAATVPASLADRLQAARLAASGAEVLTTPLSAEAAEQPVAALDQSQVAAGELPAPAAAPPQALPSFAQPQLPWWRRAWLALNRALRWRKTSKAQPGESGGPGHAAGSTAAAQARPVAQARPRGPLTALFSGKFLWPVTPARVARWARRHGSLQPLAPPDWPVRHVAAEPALQQQARLAGRPAPTTVHLFTAAIGVDDRRMRVLVSADGQVLGPRAYDRKRVGAVGLVVALALVGLGWRLQPAALPGLPPADESAESVQLAASTELAASAETAASAASAAMPSDTPASEAPAEPPPGASAAPAPGSLKDAHTVKLADAASTQPPPAAHAEATPAPLTNMPQTGQPKGDQATHRATTHAAGAASATGPAVAERARQPGEVIVTSTPPPTVPQRRASGPLAQIRPQLTEDVRLAARAQSEAARQAADKSQPMPVVVPTQRYAVVSLPERDRETAEARLATMLSVRAQLPPPAPLHSDVMPAQGRWRVALWPFANQADAARAQEMLQVRGLRAEVVEF